MLSSRSTGSLGIYGVILLTAAIGFLPFSGHVNADGVVWYQVLGGGALAIGGGMISGWGIASFLGSADKKGSRQRTGKAQAYTVGSGKPKSRDPQETVPAASPLQGLHLDAPLERISGIGPVRARKAAELGFRTLLDVARANREGQAKLREALGSKLFDIVLLMAQSALTLSLARKVR